MRATPKPRPVKATRYWAIKGNDGDYWAIRKTRHATEEWLMAWRGERIVRVEVKEVQR